MDNLIVIDCILLLHIIYYERLKFQLNHKHFQIQHTLIMLELFLQ